MQPGIVILLYDEEERDGVCKAPEFSVSRDQDGAHVQDKDGDGPSVILFYDGSNEG